MAKKNFGKAIDAILNSPAKNIENKTKLTRTTLLLDEDLLEKIRAISYWERTTIKSFIENSLQNTLSHFDESVIKKALEEYKKNK